MFGFMFVTWILSMCIANTSTTGNAFDLDQFSDYKYFFEDIEGLESDGRQAVNGIVMQWFRI